MWCAKESRMRVLMFGPPLQKNTLLELNRTEALTVLAVERVNAFDR